MLGFVLRPVLADCESLPAEPYHAEKGSLSFGVKGVSVFDYTCTASPIALEPKAQLIEVQEWVVVETEDKVEA